ncbi:MAG: hypothetical protein WCI92_00475 [Bacteroidota bacterium]
MRARLLLCGLLIALVCGCGASAFAMDTKGGEITYPPKGKPTEIKDIVASFDSLTASVKDLAGAMVGDIKKQGLINSVTTHQKFYASIFVYVFLYLIWSRTRDRK